ncbi:3-oxoacyl-ACP reductase FabG [Patescibacteria group bacterium]|nr:3-oxoacyl-ACP reductase FabG [Patescibacteria group bacterium]
MDLTNKVVLVTGASRGIGRATALAFAREGCKVVVNYYKEKSKAEAVGQDLMIQADVADFKAFKAMVDKVVKKLGRIDVLVNNAGVIIQTNQDFQQITDEVWDRTLDVNLKGVFNGIKAVAPFMKKQGQGRIINLASVFGQLGAAPVMAYTVAKAGVENLTKAFAKALAPEITVNAVAPAVCHTDMTKGSGPALIKFFKDNTPMQRIAQPEEIAAAIVFLAKSDFITGQILNVDGGYGLK